MKHRKRRQKWIITNITARTTLRRHHKLLAQVFCVKWSCIIIHSFYLFLFQFRGIISAGSVLRCVITCISTIPPFSHCLVQSIFEPKLQTCGVVCRLFEVSKNNTSWELRDSLFLQYGFGTCSTTSTPHHTLARSSRQCYQFHQQLLVMLAIGSAVVSRESGVIALSNYRTRIYTRLNGSWQTTSYEFCWNHQYERVQFVRSDEGVTTGYTSALFPLEPRQAGSNDGLDHIARGYNNNALPIAVWRFLTMITTPKKPALKTTALQRFVLWT